MISPEAQIVSENNEISENHQELCTAIIHDQVSSSQDSFSTRQIETEGDYADSLKSSGAAHVGDGSRVFQTTENYPTQTKARDNIVPSGGIPEDIHCQKFRSKWQTHVRIKSLMAAKSCKEMYGISTKIQNTTTTTQNIP